MKFINIFRNTKFAISIAGGLFSSINSFSQNPDQVRINGVVRDTSEHLIENANAKIWKADNAAIFETTETDFWGEYMKDISTPVENIPVENYSPLRVLNSGNSNHIGIEGTINQEPTQIIITDIIGRAIANIPFNYDIGNKMVSADWKSRTPGIYFANLITNDGKESIKFLTFPTESLSFSSLIPSEKIYNFDILFLCKPLSTSRVCSGLL